MILSIAGQKGGVGKTTSAVNIAAGLAYLRHKVALVDVDPQANASILTGHGDEIPGLYSMLMTVNADIRDWLYVVDSWRYTPDHEQPGEGVLALLPSNVDTSRVAIHKDNTVRLRQLFDQLQQAFDYIIVDMPPTLSLQQSAFLGISDTVLIPTICESLALRGVIRTISHVNEVSEARPAPLKILGVLPNKYKDTIEHREFLADIRQRYGSLVWDVLPDWIIYADANTAGRSVFAYAPGHEAANRMLDVVYRVEAANGE